MHQTPNIFFKNWSPVVQSSSPGPVNTNTLSRVHITIIKDHDTHYVL